MIAYCGLSCDSCPIHLAALESDPVKQMSLREEVARKCREVYGMDLNLQDVTDCDGCSSATGRLFSGCVKCEIRKCAIRKKVGICASCPDYLCGLLQKRFEIDQAARARLEILRSESS
jgi:hypothetical protein